jgi:hypothetical protein
MPERITSRSAPTRAATWAEAVVVADLDLFVGDGVVLVDDRDEALAGKEEVQRRAGIAGAGAAIEIPVGQQHLRTEELMTAEVLTVFRHQFRLADRGAGLEFAGFLRALLEAHGGHAGGDGSGGDQHDLDAALMQAGDLIDDAADLDAVDLAVLAGEEAGTELDDPTFCHGFEGSTLAEGKRRCPASERRPQNEGGCRPTASQPFGARTRPCGVRTT